MKFNLFSNCKLVRGIHYSAIYDLQMGRLISIDNIVADAIQWCQHDSISGVIDANPNMATGLKSYLEYFVKIGIGYYTDEDDQYIDIGHGFATNYDIKSLHLEYSGTYDLKKLSLQFGNSIIKYAQIRALNSDCDILDLITFVESLDIRCVDLYINVTSNKNHDIIYEARSKVKRIRHIYICGGPFRPRRNNVRGIRYVSNSLNSGHVERISKNSMLVNFPMFNISQNLHPHFYKNISIDTAGDLKNSLNSVQAFGNVTTSNLNEVYNSIAFRRKWFVKRDSILICMDCKYRYSCAFSSDVIEQSNGFWSLMHNCAYNTKNDSWK